LQELEKEIRQPLLEVRENLTSVITKADRIPQARSGMLVEKFAATTTLALSFSCFPDNFKCQKVEMRGISIISYRIVIY
jgi:hypothetical protein